MDTVISGIFLGLVLFIIILIIIQIMKYYTDIANIVGEKILNFIKYLLRKIKNK